MLQTVEALLDAQGKLKFLENVHWQSTQRVLVTFLQAQAALPSSQTPGIEQPHHSHAYDFSDLCGRLQWQGDALAEQKRLRNEW